MLNLIELFLSIESIATTDDAERFAALPIPNYKPHRLGKDALGKPLLLISILNVRSQNQRTPIVLEHLRVQYNLNCRVSRPDGTFEEGVFTVVHCTGEDVTLQKLLPEGYVYHHCISWRSTHSIRCSPCYKPVN